MSLFDQHIIDLNLQRASTRYTQEDRFLYRWAETQLLDRLSDIKRDFKNTLLISDFPIALDNKTIRQNAPPHECVISLFNLHRLEHPDQYLNSIFQSLKPDGLFLGLFFGGDTLQELKQALINTELNLSKGTHQRTLPLLTKQEAGALMQASGFSLPVVDSQYVRVGYKKLSSLYKDLRAMGETNPLTSRSKHIPPKKFFNEVEAYYRDHFYEDGTYTATFEVIFCTGWSPHSSQQKPLKRGSGAVSLKDVL